MLKKEDIRIRDPFVFTDKEKNVYYVYGTTDLKEGLSAGNKFSVYISADLESFEGPYTVFDGDKAKFWADKDYWAAEVHKYNGKYYLIGSFKADNKRRASCILVSDSPTGEFTILSDNARTPEKWDCLDGTLYVENDKPYLVFSHEWTQCVVGEMYAVPMKEDLSEPVGEPFLLFKASDNPWVSGFEHAGKKGCKVTDGPFLFREDGKLKMIWSSFSNGRYVVLEAVADGIKGVWEHFPPRFDFDGGHAMIFEDFNGEKFFSLHSPNVCPDERMRFIKYDKQVKRN